MNSVLQEIDTVGKSLLRRFNRTFRQQVTDPLVVTPPSDGYGIWLAEVRRKLAACALKLNDERALDATTIWPFRDLNVPVSSGMLMLPRTPAEDDFCQALVKNLESGWGTPGAFAGFLAATLYFQNFELPFIKDIEHLNEDQLNFYLAYLMRTSFFLQPGDDVRYRDYMIALMDWLGERIVAETDPKRFHQLAMNVIDRLSIGYGIMIDAPIRALLESRWRLMETMARHMPPLQNVLSPLPLGVCSRMDGKVRIGVMARSVMAGPDTWALLAQFEQFDRTRYEFFLYTIDLNDAVYRHDVNFYTRFFGMLTAIRTLNTGTLDGMAQQIRKDELDIFFFCSANCYGFNSFDFLPAYKLAPLHIAVNSVVPTSTGLPSFDVMLAAETTPENHQQYVEECNEAVWTIPGVSITYSLPVSREPKMLIDRASLGLERSDIVFCNGASESKLVPVLLDCWMEILQTVPNSKLVLFPFNPGWSGTVYAFSFEHRLRFALERHGLSRDRVCIVRQLAASDTDQVLMLSDVYLSTFPHGGATSVTLALRAGLPTVTRESPWLRGTADPLLVRTLGLPELVGRNNAEYVDIAIRLGRDTAWRRKIRDFIRAHHDQAPVFDQKSYSRKLQGLIDDIVIDYMEKQAANFFAA